MMMKLSEIRTKYPQYDDLSDQQLADALHKKYPQLSKTDLYKRIGFKVTTQKPTASKPLDLKKVATNIPESLWRRVGIVSHSPCLDMHLSSHTLMRC